MSFIAKLKEGRKKAQERTDPWHLRLEGLKGKIWDDGIERISTQTVFDILEVPHRSRTAGACRRLSKLMRELGWHPIKAGVRVYSRSVRREPRTRKLSWYVALWGAFRGCCKGEHI